MESISIQKYSMQIYAYSGSGASGSKIPAKGSDPPAAGKTNCDFQSKDGDSVTLSIQARFLQVSETNTGANSNGNDLMNAFMNGSDGSGQADGASGQAQTADGKSTDGNSAADLFKSLLAKFSDLLNSASGSGSGSDDAPSTDDGQKAKHAHGHHHHHGHQPKMVADDQGGQGGQIAQDFRAQINALVASGRDAWAKGGDPGQATQA